MRKSFGKAAGLPAYFSDEEILDGLPEVVKWTLEAFIRDAKRTGGVPDLNTIELYIKDNHGEASPLDVYLGEPCRVTIGIKGMIVMDEEDEDAET